ncbi:MAG: hypothetical protein ACE5GS_16930 [Kiloniellaceae bacterium]
MPNEPTYDAMNNRRYQADLAAVLVAGLGVEAEAALETCRANGWEGVVSVLLAERPAARRLGTHESRNGQ